jgi:hypothetical protein
MTQQRIGKLAYDFANMDKKLFETTSGATGSLYFKEDVPADLQTPSYVGKEAMEDSSFA